MPDGVKQLLLKYMKITSYTFRLTRKLVWTDKYQMASERDGVRERGVTHRGEVASTHLAFAAGHKSVLLQPHLP